MLKDVFNEYGPKGFAILQQAITKVKVTGRTLASLKFIIDIPNQKLTYLGRGFMEALEKGRGPRRENKYGNFDNNLEDWLKAKGFAQKKTKSGKVYYQLGSQWFTAKALAWKINKEGDKTWRQGHGEKVKDVYTKDMDVFKEEFTKAVMEDQKKEFKNKVLEAWR